MLPPASELFNLWAWKRNSVVCPSLRGLEPSWTPLHEAVRIGNSTIVESLLDYGVDVNSTSDKGFTPLLVACINGQLGLLNRLLEKGADPSAVTINGVNLLHAAASSGSSNTLERVIRLREELEAQGVDDVDEARWTPLHFACRRANTAVVRMLLKKQGNPQVEDKDSRTILHRAAGAGYLPVVRFLLNNTPLLDEQDSEGFTALSYACIGGFEAIVKELLVFGASPHFVTLELSDGCLHFACRLGYDDIARSLINAMADINFRNVLGYTPLYEAILRHRRSTVQLLVSQGAQVDSHLKDYLGRTLFDFSVLHTFPESFSNDLSSIRTPSQLRTSITYLVTTVQSLIKQLAQKHSNFRFLPLWSTSMWQSACSSSMTKDLPWVL
jgi:ankyrin repeat protein